MESEIDDLVAKLVNQLDANQREAYEERAGIMEFDAGYPRRHAECLALLDLYCNVEPFVTVTPIEIELSGTRQWILTTNPDAARQWLADIGGKEISVRHLDLVIDEDCGGIALLTTVEQRGYSDLGLEHSM